MALWTSGKTEIIKNMDIQRIHWQFLTYFWNLWLSVYNIRKSIWNSNWIWRVAWRGKGMASTKSFENSTKISKKCLQRMPHSIRRETSINEFEILFPEQNVIFNSTNVFPVDCKSSEQPIRFSLKKFSIGQSFYVLCARVTRETK